MKSAKLVFSFGVILATATSVQVKGMDQGLKPEQRTMILQMQRDIASDQMAAEKNIQILKADTEEKIMPYHRRKVEIEDLKNKIKAYQQKDQKLQDILNANKAYDTNMIRVIYQSK